MSGGSLGATEPRVTRRTVGAVASGTPPRAGMEACTRFIASKLPPSEPVARAAWRTPSNPPPISGVAGAARASHFACGMLSKLSKLAARRRPWLLACTVPLVVGRGNFGVAPSSIGVPFTIGNTAFIIVDCHSPLPASGMRAGGTLAGGTFEGVRFVTVSQTWRPCVELPALAAAAARCSGLAELSHWAGIDGDGMTTADGAERFIPAADIASASRIRPRPRMRRTTGIAGAKR
mmetsp:Transcript_12517/g.32022  ORF Transcript_12517/g.32022 Transcript_12517/m.32022 type:complete len:234 (+) Transcript_12517:2423-3124(+)